MANEIVVKNTLAFQFPANAAQPTLADMGRFIKTLRGNRVMMDTAYKISDEKSVFIRFKTEEAMKFSLENNSTTLPFRYTDGKQVMVRMSVAGGNTRYIRVFDLPPEVTDLDLSSVFGKYGTVKRIIRERFPADIGLDMFSGVRGLYVDVQTAIPETLHFRGRKGRVFYDGVKSKCYVCKSEAHLKKACPIYKRRQAEESDQQCEQQRPERESEIDQAVSSIEAGTGVAVAPVTSMETTSKQRDQRENKIKITETKRQHSIESDITSQPQQKKTSVQPERDSDSDGTMITIPDDQQTNIMDNSTESESDLETLDWKNTSPEAHQAWMEKRERKNRRMDRKIERYLSKQPQ